ncbi:hypothetical protein MSAN_01402000 [Mycena sanguinolenta]|uniref:F-box domain-containing protein n=1 Tax=Mycena sanguinolenta TaxID=230812 RepID=A0A8H6YB62_9AGAR|nr:hypothetical protein MSAN_01402000 [Mycena sanguinolenta]
MDLLELKQQCLVLCHALKQIKRNDSQAQQQCLDILSQAEAIDINLERAHPWPPSLLLLRRFLEAKQGLFKDPILKSRLLVLVQRWDRLQVAAVGYSWSKRFPPRVAPSLSLPPEVLLKILWSHVADTHKTHQQRWGEQADFALNCALVSKAWNAAASNLLYRGVIRLFKVISATKLLRTLADDRPNPRVISHLVLSPHYLEEATFPEVASSLLGHCPSIQRLQISASDLLRVPSIDSSFEYLRELRLQGVSLKEFAPILTKLPSLSILAAVNVQNGGPGAFKWGSEPPGDNMGEIPAPTYRLAELHLRGMLLTPEQVRWIIGASEILDLLSLHGIYAPSLPRIIGPLVKTLRLTPGDSPIEEKRTHLAAVIPMFSSLVSLQLCGEDWLLEAPFLRTINAPFTQLVISWSWPPSGFENLFAALEDTGWQPQILEICVDPEEQANLDPIKAHPASQKLRDMCDGRNIALRWLLRKEFAGSFAPTSGKPRHTG